MNVVFTIVLFAGLATWAFAIYSRLLRQRDRIKEAWRKVEADRTNAAVLKVYNDCVAKYNESLLAFPANVVAMLAGFKSAQAFKSEV